MTLRMPGGVPPVIITCQSEVVDGGLAARHRFAMRRWRPPREVRTTRARRVVTRLPGRRSGTSWSSRSASAAPTTEGGVLRSFVADVPDSRGPS
jgi:hypothetical protein